MISLGLLIGALVIGEEVSSPWRLAVIRKAPDFNLVDQTGNQVRLKDYRGKVLLVNFIFTTCNGTCPATTHRMARVKEELQKRKLLERGIQFLSLTLDPGRDTPEVLQRYMRLYDIDPGPWSFLTGPPEKVRQVNESWGMWARPAANGQLDHPSRIFLVDRQGRIREIYNLDFFRPAWVAQDVDILTREK